MTTTKPTPPSPSPTTFDDESPSSIRCYPTDDTYKPWLVFVILLVVCCGAALVFAGDPATQDQSRPQQYQVSNLASLGGTNSRGNSINNREWVAGHSNLTGNQSRHATLWRDGTVLDLGTLGGPNSAVAWPVKNTQGILVGIAQTNRPDPLGENWSSAAFYTGPNTTGFINLGFVWERGHMRALPTLGGNHGFATGANNHGQAVGWAENTCRDGTCVPPQVLQFRPVVWDLNHGDRIRELPLFRGDTSGAATGINDEGQAIGISGICDQAIGRHTARHAVLWDNGRVIDLGNLGAPYWNTPTAINQRGDIVGFAGTPGDPEGNILHAFIWTKKSGIKPLGALPGRTPQHVHSEAYGINERRQVVGISCDADFTDCRGFVWENGVMRDINDLKQPAYTARIEQAKDINDSGEITGRALDPTTGVRTAFLAKPGHEHDCD